MTKRSLIFAGPSLTSGDRERYSSFIFSPPAERGDVLRVLYRYRKDPLRQIGLIDGYFDDRPSVLHKELLQAMSLGVQVYGAGSMGALRAAELSPYGMTGVGEVFRGYQEGRLTSDADVAVCHGPEDLGFPVLTLPQVEVVETVRLLENRRKLDTLVADHLIETSRQIFYKNRTWAHLVDMAGIDDEELSDLLHLFQAERVPVKRRDAIALLERMSCENEHCDISGQSFAQTPPLTPAFQRVNDTVIARELANEERLASLS